MKHGGIAMIGQNINDFSRDQLNIDEEQEYEHEEEQKEADNNDDDRMKMYIFEDNNSWIKCDDSSGDGYVHFLRNNN